MFIQFSAFSPHAKSILRYFVLVLQARWPGARHHMAGGNLPPIGAPAEADYRAPAQVAALAWTPGDPRGPPGAGILWGSVLGYQILHFIMFYLC